MSIYLSGFDFPGKELENTFFEEQRMTCFNNFYPFQVLDGELTHIDFEPVTIFYGGNGSGKSTILNVIAEKLKIQRSIRFNKSSFFEDYVELCDYQTEQRPLVSKILTSDDVFNNLFSVRARNELIDAQRNSELENRRAFRQSGVTARELVGDGGFLENLERLKNINDARSKSASSYVKKRVAENLIGKSNGETGIDFFTDAITEPGLYLLDEPENSLSVAFQTELTRHLFESARFFGAQLIIATHSPFILSVPNAKIYNLDKSPVCYTRDWTQLENMKTYYSFFKQYSEKFEKG